MGSSIHQTAIVHPNAQIGENVEIGPYAVIGENVVVGEGTKIFPHVVIEGWTTIGKECQIFAGVSIGSAPQDLKFKDEKSYVFIGDGTTIRECATVNRPVGEGEVTRVGSGVLMMAYTHVAHNCTVGDQVIMANAATLAGHVTVGNKAVIGGLAGVHQFVHIGDLVMIGGLTKITQDIPPYLLVDGNPAQIHGINRVGLMRNGFSEDSRKQIKRIYKLLYRSGLNTSQAIEALKEMEPTPDTEKYLEFFAQKSGRGITR